MKLLQTGMWRVFAKLLADNGGFNDWRDSILRYLVDNPPC